MRFSYNCILAGLNTENLRTELEKIGYTRVGDSVGNYIITSQDGTYSCYTEREFMIMRYGGRLEDHVLSIKNPDYFLSVARMKENSGDDQEYVCPREWQAYEGINIPCGPIYTSLGKGDHKITLYEIKERFGIGHSYKFDELSIGYRNKIDSINMFHTLRSVLKDVEIDPTTIKGGESCGYLTLTRETGKLSISPKPEGHECRDLKEFIVLALATKEWDLNQYMRVGEDIVFSTDFCCCGGNELDNESIVEKIREEN